MNSLRILLEHLLAAYLLLSMATRGRVAWRLGATTTSRAALYWRTIVWQWGMVALVLGVAPAAWPAAQPAADPALVFVVVANVLVTMYTPVALAWRHRGIRRWVLAPFAPLRALLPATPGQRALWVALSLTTGVCEELLFRGWGQAYLMRAPWGLGSGAAALATSLVFGIGHGDQGWRGVLRTAAFGLAMSALAYATGGLSLPMFVHAAVNLRIALLPRGDLAPPQRRAVALHTG